MSGSDVQITAKDGGTFMGYLASPADGSGPGIIAIQEIFGVNQGMRQICDQLASLGYFALSPDLFWRQEPGIQLTDQSDEEWQKAFALYNGFDVDKGIDDIAASIDWLRGHEGGNGKVGAVGYCLGGLLAYLTACRTDVNAAVGFYGVGIQDRLDEASGLTTPLMLHIAEEDGFVDKEAQAAVHGALDGKPNIVLHDYPGVDHAFARPDGVNWDRDAADQANLRTAHFFGDHLKG